MGSYLDTSWGDLRALTREHRAVGRARMLAARAAHEALSFPVVPRNVQDEIEAAWNFYPRGRWELPHIVWKNAQWAAGHHTCGYCGIRMTRTPNTPRTCTVDHRKARAYGGLDDPSNWIMACLRCNGLKGDRSEKAFRATICAPA